MFSALLFLVFSHIQQPLEIVDVFAGFLFALFDDKWKLTGIVHPDRLREFWHDHHDFRMKSQVVIT